MAKGIKLDAETRDLLKQGVDKLADAMKITLGPKSHNVATEKESGAPQVTKDGVAVAKEIELEDALENTGTQLVKNVAPKTNDDTGDGITTATILTQAIVSEGLKNVTAGANPMDLKCGIDRAVSAVVEYIKVHTEQVGNNCDKTEQATTVSANNDIEIGKFLADAMRKMSKNGVITIRESKSRDTNISVVEGMQFGREYLSSYSVTDTDKTKSVMENPYILIYEREISNTKEFSPILQNIAESSRPLLVIAEDIGSEVLATLVVNRLCAGLKICTAKAPSFGGRRKVVLEDTAVLTGDVVISKEKGLKLEQATLEMSGSAEKVMVNKDYTTVVNDGGQSENTQARINQTKAEIENTTSSCDKEKLQEHLVKSSGDVAVLCVGVNSEVKMKEKEDRAGDALYATRVVTEGSVVVGGGITHICALDALKGMKGMSTDEQTGINIVERAIEESLRQIVTNADGEGAAVVDEARQGKNDYGYNTRTDSYEDLRREGIVDPTKVARVALENTASVADMFLVTECLIVDKPEEKPAMPAAPGMGGMM